jgi:hypothetical protein
LLGVASHHEPEQMGPEGFPIDWHGVRAFYEVQVEETRHPAAIEVGGSTAEACWFARDALTGLPVTEVTHEALAAFHRP